MRIHHKRGSPPLTWPRSCLEAGADAESDGTGVVPDGKAWTWVLERPCPECGLEVWTVTPPRIAELLRDNAARWPDVLARPDVGRSV
jgi:hypothetical protein